MSILVELKQNISAQELMDAFEEAAKKVGAEYKKEGIAEQSHLALGQDKTEVVAKSEKCRIVIPAKKSRGFFMRLRKVVCEAVVEKKSSYKNINLTVKSIFRPTWKWWVLIVSMVPLAIVPWFLFGFLLAYGITWVAGLGLVGLSMMLLTSASSSEVDLKSFEFEAVQPHLLGFLDEVSKVSHSSLQSGSQTEPPLLTGGE